MLEELNGMEWRHSLLQNIGCMVAIETVIAGMVHLQKIYVLIKKRTQANLRLIHRLDLYCDSILFGGSNQVQ